MIVEKRADGKVETEATIKIWVDGERYVRTAEGNGPVHALDRALRAAIGEIHPHLRGHRARQLQGPHPRRDRRHRAPSRACCSTPPTARDVWGSIGVSENVIEASLGRARRLARVREQPGRQPARAARRARAA